jgi:ribonuclease G
MSQELFINVMSAEVRAALMEDASLIDLIVERRERASVVGNIYLGRVERVMKGMEAAFIDIGTAKSGFLGLDDNRRGNGESSVPVHEGEAVLVQVTKDAINGKGVQLSRRVTLPGRALVYAPAQDRVMVSRQIEDEAERDRLTGLMGNIASDGEGFILRTASVGATAEELNADCEQLRETWQGIEDAQATVKAPSCLHADLDPVLRVLRDHALDRIDTIHVDDGAAADSARKFCERAMPGMADRVKLHTGKQQLFEQFGIEEEIERACVTRVDLPSGGGLVVETVEALTSIDVNSGRFDAASDLEQMALRTNCEAAAEAARQIRLRNISGLIVIDFIHMENEGNWTEIIEILDNVTGRDRNPTRVLGVTEAGLVEITRRRRREPLLHTMTEICKVCGGVGRIKSLDAVSIEILRLLKREARVVPPGEMVLYAANDVVMSLENDYGELVDGVEDETGRTIHLRADREYVRENYDIVVEQTGEQAGS